MPLKVDLRPGVRFFLRAARAGGAWLGIGLIVGSAQPIEILVVAASAVTLMGGIAATAQRRHLYVRLAICAAAVLLARAVAGPLAATVVAVLVTFGWWLRLTPAAALAGLAVFGIGAAVMGMASVRLFASFWILGAASIGCARVWRRFRYRRLRGERASAVVLARENSGSPAPVI